MKERLQGLQQNTTEPIRSPRAKQIGVQSFDNLSGLMQNPTYMS